MYDLVSRLRERHSFLCDEAADALEAKDAEIARLRVLLTECGEFIVLGVDEGCEPGGCAECDMHRLRRRIGAALAGAAVQPEGCCLDYPRCDCNSPPEPDDDWLCFQRPAQPKVTHER